ncbi:Ceramidase [Carex littledalei]|uniref:Ceramidase n=1 Tax=Carex littledalei TaxID=544730 RepID=A0A833RCN9_9POAL|nr:Ceramidase [Carex littledalei]
MEKSRWIAWGAALVIFGVLMVVTPKIPQSEEYHDFADQRKLLFGIPNTLNVISNIPFFFVGIIGLVLCYWKNYFQLSLQGELWGWTLFYLGVTAVGFGSSYYHLNPNDATLVWDRLPMTVAFTSIVAIFIIERVDEKKGTISLLPLFLAGVLSIVYWRYFDDLRPYAAVQFVPCIVIPVMAIIIPPMYTHSSYWLWAAGFYLLAKVTEAMDKPIYKWTHQIVSGHTLKHLFAAMVPVYLTLMLAKRTIELDRRSLLTIWKVRLVEVKERRRFKSNSTETSLDVQYSAVSTTNE